MKPWRQAWSGPGTIPATANSNPNAPVTASQAVRVHLNKVAWWLDLQASQSMSHIHSIPTAGADAADAVAKNRSTAKASQPGLYVSNGAVCVPEPLDDADRASSASNISITDDISTVADAAVQMLGKAGEEALPVACTLVKITAPDCDSDITHRSARAPRCPLPLCTPELSITVRLVPQRQDLTVCVL